MTSFTIQQYGLAEIYKATLMTQPTLAWFMLAGFGSISVFIWFFGHLAYIHENNKRNERRQNANKEEEQPDNDKNDNLGLLDPTIA